MHNQLFRYYMAIVHIVTTIVQIFCVVWICWCIYVEANSRKRLSNLRFNYASEDV